MVGIGSESCGLYCLGTTIYANNKGGYCSSKAGTEGRGRPPKIDEEAEAKIEQLLESDPTEYGESASRWTTPRIVEHLRPS